jgi:hypothetical protein
MNDLDDVEAMIDWAFQRWPGATDELERARWRQVMRPISRLQFSPERLEQAAWLIDHPAFGGRRPPTEALTMAFDVATRALPWPASTLDFAGIDRSMPALEQLSADLDGAWWPPATRIALSALTLVSDSAGITDPIDRSPA